MRSRSSSGSSVPEAATPLTAFEFAQAMAAMAPFETAPALAVAVSGGADSMALTLLAADWIARRGGTLTALTVDHRLRAAAAAEAEQVGRWLAARGIGHRVLRAAEAIPAAGGIPEAARRLRYALLEDWCRQQGVLHLLLAHHRDDQIETVLMRVLRDSGVHGLAGMRPILELAGLRILRPLLGTAPARLRALLEERGQPWIEDPTNRDRRFTRNRLRAALAQMPSAPALGADLLALSARAAAVAGEFDAATDALLAHACRLDAAGFAELDLAMMRSAEDGVAVAALGRALACVSGRRHAAGRRAIERLWQRLTAADTAFTATLGGCQVRARDDVVLVVREQRHLPEPRAVEGGLTLAWDGRFRLRVEAGGGAVPLTLRALGAIRGPDGGAGGALPAAARATLPALFDGGEAVAVPHLRIDRLDPARHAVSRFSAVFQPRRSLAGDGYSLA